MRVWVRTVGQTHHKLQAKCRLEASDTREATAEVVIFEDVHLAFGRVNPDPLHDMKSRYLDLNGKMTGPYCRAVVLWILQKGFEMLASTGKPLFVYGEGLLKMPQWSGQQVQ